MRFLDQAKIYISSGAGGAGCVSFRREKFIEFGGNEELIFEGESDPFGLRAVAESRVIDFDFLTHCLDQQ